MAKLEGQAALVTGAGRGIGAATAYKLAREGARVLAVDLDEAPVAETVGRIRAHGFEASALAADVTSADFGERATGMLVERYGAVDIVVNNAGYIWNTTIQNTSDEQWHAMLDVHATAVFRLLRAALPHLRRRDEAAQTRQRKVVNVSSVSGVYGAATQVAYATGKAAVVGLTRTLAKEWGRYGINVNCVAFGYIETRLTQATPPEGATIKVAGKTLKVGFPAEVSRALPRSIALGRAGTPEEAAGAIFLLCLPEADFVTGQVLECSGGLL